jgi:hypothetical protein
VFGTRASRVKVKKVLKDTGAQMLVIDDQPFEAAGERLLEDRRLYGHHAVILDPHAAGEKTG